MALALSQKQNFNAVLIKVYVLTGTKHRKIVKDTIDVGKLLKSYAYSFSDKEHPFSSLRNSICNILKHMYETKVFHTRIYTLSLLFNTHFYFESHT